MAWNGELTNLDLLVPHLHQHQRNMNTAINGRLVSMGKAGKSGARLLLESGITYTLVLSKIRDICHKKNGKCGKFEKQNPTSFVI